MATVVRQVRDKGAGGWEEAKKARDIAMSQVRWELDDLTVD